MTDSEQRKNILTLLGEAQKSGARMASACAQIGLSKRTVQHWRTANAPLIDRRTLVHHSPPNKLSPIEITHLLAVANSIEFGHLPPSQIVPRLADQGIFLASESTLYRALHAALQLTHRRSEEPAQARKKPRHISVTGINQCYTWDITYLPTLVLGQYFYLYMHIDIFSRKIVGWVVHENESSAHASVLLRDIYVRENIKPGQLILHSDNGAPMKGSSLLATMQQLGVAASLSRPSCSNDSPFSESAFGTLKYRPNMPLKPFADLAAACAWVTELVRWYNHEHRHCGIKFVTPGQRHAGLDQDLLQRRHALYQAAKAKNPNRWSGETRNWQRVERVDLNPQKIEEIA